MKTIIKSFILCLALIGAFSCVRKDVWRSMMPDEKVSNWRVVSGEVDPSTSSDEIVLTGNKVMIYGPSDTDRALPVFRNFVFSTKALVKTESVSSLWIHHGNDYGYEIALGNRRNDGANLKRGSLVNVRNIYKSLAPDGEWFDLEVAVMGKNITIKINGTLVVDYVEPAEPYRTTEGFSRLGSGTFILDSYLGESRFRDMQVKILDDEATGRTDAADETSDRIIRLQQEGFPVVDYHVHLKGWTARQAMDNSRHTGIFYAVAPNCGIGFPITDDAGVDNFIDSMRNMPALLAMQGEGREWPTTFSKSLREQFDLVFTDALTFTDHKGRRVRLWIDDEVIIDIPEQQYMDMIVDKTVEVIRTEPIDVFVNPFFLPTAMMPNYDALWTDKRIARVVDALVEKRVALEVNARYRIPNAHTIEAAMNAGVKLTFGTNNADANIGKLEYCFEMMDECGITAADMWFPAPEPIPLIW